MGAQLYLGSMSLGRRFGRFLLQPVWIPGKRSVPKQRSRGFLFATDVLRFGAGKLVDAVLLSTDQLKRKARPTYAGKGGKL